MRDTLSGACLLGRYELQRRLGQGGHASVYAARDRFHDKTVAFKLLRPRTPEGFEALRSEFHLLAGLYHPHLCQVHDFGRVRVEGALLAYYTATLIEGVPIDEYLRTKPWPWIQHALADALKALEFLHHSGIRHGDFKPANILVDAAGRATLIDLSCSAPPELGTVSGTRGFIAPELFDGRPPDVRSDLYSVGCTLRGLIEGSNAVHDEVRKLADRLCQRDPESRPFDIDEVLIALGEPRERAELQPCRAPTMVGRQAVIHAAADLVSSLQSESAGPRMLVLHGPPGCGKTRALAECKWLAQLDLRVVEGCLSFERPVQALIRQGWDTPFASTDIALALELRSRLDECRRDPLLLLLDDIQKLSEQERRILWAVLAILRNDDPVGFVLTSPSAVEGPAGVVCNLELTPLDQQDIRQWVGPTPTERFVRELLVRSGGLPRRIAIALAQEHGGEDGGREDGGGEDGRKHGRDYGSELGAETQEGGSTDSESPRTRVCLRTARLDSDAIRALGLCVALGGNLDLGLAKDLNVAPSSLETICRHGWTLHEQGALRLVSFEEAPVLADALGAAPMASWHAELATLLERKRHEPPPAMAYHWAAARHPERAERIMLDHRAQWTRDPHPWRDAADLVAVSAPTPTRWLLAAELFELCGELDRAATWVDRCLALGAELGLADRSGAEFRAGSIALKQGNAVRSLAHLERAQELEALPERRAAIADLICRAHIQRGTWSSVEPIASLALEWTTDREILANLHEDLGVACSYLGRVDDAERELDHAQTLCQATTPRQRVRTIAYRAIHEYRRGHLDAAEANHRLALELAEGAGLLDQAASCALNLASVLHRRGNWGAALDSNEQGLRRALVVGKTRTIVTLYFNFAQLYCDIGRFDRASQQAAQASERAERARMPFFVGLCCMLRGEIAFLLGKADIARAELERAEAILKSQQAEREVAEVLLHSVDLELGCRGWEAAATTLGRAEQAIDQNKADDLRTRVLLLKARLALSNDRGAEAISMLELAERRSHDNGELDLEAEIAAWQACAFAERQAHHAQRRHRLRALELWDRCAATLPTELRESFWAHPKRAILNTQTLDTLDTNTGLSTLTGPALTTTGGPAATSVRFVVATSEVATTVPAGAAPTTASAALPASATDSAALPASATPNTAPPADAPPPADAAADRALSPSNESREQNLERLLAIYKRLSGSAHTREILEVAMDAAIELTGAERGFLILREGENAGDKMKFAVARNLDRERIGRSAVKISRSIAERVLQTGEPLLTAEAQHDARFASNESIVALGLRSVICVPIPGPTGVLGALYLDNRFQRGRFQSTHLELLLAFADQVGIVLNHARLRDELDARTKQLERERQRIAGLLEVRSREVERLNEQVRVAHQALHEHHEKSGIVGKSAALRAVLATVERVADSTLTVLIQGESGTGKELIARAVHRLSPRQDAPFVSVNCAALPETLLESELFGHVRGAFTGADRDRTGLMVHAQNGTLFLDEIGEMPMSMQAKLLRAIQEREVRPLGSARSVAVEARVVCASNRILHDEVRAGRFREDLYYRLAVVEIVVPPLRDRMEDCPLLVQHLIQRLARQQNRKPLRILPEALRKLMAFEWPGNIRQLENVVSQALVFAQSDCIAPNDIILPKDFATDGPPPTRVRGGHRGFQEREAAEIRAALETSRWNATEVSRQLGIPRTSLYRKLKRYGLARER